MVEETKHSIRKSIRIKKKHLDFIENEFIPYNKGKYGNIGKVVNKFIDMVIREIKRKQQDPDRF